MFAFFIFADFYFYKYTSFDLKYNKYFDVSY